MKNAFFSAFDYPKRLFENNWEKNFGTPGAPWSRGGPEPQIMKNAFFCTFDDAKRLIEKNCLGPSGLLGK